jgi:SAM-dependent methyltransferase
MADNIVYRTDAISRHYSTHRRRWADLYPSERSIFDRLGAANVTLTSVLDVGCAAGGLAEALAERFPSIRSYTGIDINAQAIESARRLTNVPGLQTQFITDDICGCAALTGERFDLVAALSVADWNVDAHGMIAACWNHVRPGGHLVMSLRLTTQAGTCDAARSFQYIWFDDVPVPVDAERAPYNVFNIRDALRLLAGQAPRPERIEMCGYWGTPSPTARTPYARLLFSVIALQRAADDTFSGEPIVDACVPVGAFLDGETNGRV